MLGSSWSYMTFESDEELSLEGDVDLHLLNIFGMFGITENINAFVSIPFKRWNQFNVEEGSDHENVIKEGIGDITLSLRWILQNKVIGAGHRLFVNGKVFIPTGEKITEDDKSLRLGTGQYSGAIGFEWWWRTKFPWVLGTSGSATFPITESDVGYKPGNSYNLQIQTLRQIPIYDNIYPYLKLSFVNSNPEAGIGMIENNSAKKQLNGAIGLEYKWTNTRSISLSYEQPFNHELEGEQLIGKTFSFSIREIIN